MKPDGNCLYRCISLAIHGDQCDHLKVREDTAAWLLENQELMRPFVVGLLQEEVDDGIEHGLPPDSTDEQKYSALMAGVLQGGHWGGNASVYALAHVYRKLIAVYRDDDSVIECKPCVKGLTIKGRIATLSLYYSGNHYLLLSKK